jgi:predicted nucleic-acid-binding protein
MIEEGVDTNVLLRLIAGDDPAQSETARRFFYEKRESGSVIFLNQLVLVETVWNLGRVFKYPREKIIGMIGRFVMSDDVRVEDVQTVRIALDYYQMSKADFSDCLILARNQQAGVIDTKTFDKKVAKLAGFSLLW